MKNPYYSIPAMDSQAAKRIFKEYLIELGNRFKLIRTDVLHCSQIEMGEIMNLSQSEVSRIERGQRKMNILHLFTLKSLDPDLDLNTLIDTCNVIELCDSTITRREK